MSHDSRSARRPLLRRARPEAHMMTLLSIQVSRPRKTKWRRATVTTGIYKEPVAGRIMLRRHNLDGDEQADLRVHGGWDKAVALSRDHFQAQQERHARSTMPPAGGAPVTQPAGR